MSKKIAVSIPFTNTYGHTKKLYRLSPPLTHEDWDGSTQVYQYVIASGADAPFSGPETYLFPADANGEISNWGELEGSFRGDIDCDRAIENAGYQVVEDS